MLLFNRYSFKIFKVKSRLLYSSMYTQRLCYCSQMKITDLKVETKHYKTHEITNKVSCKTKKKNHVKYGT